MSPSASSLPGGAEQSCSTSYVRDLVQEVAEEARVAAAAVVAPFGTGLGRGIRTSLSCWERTMTTSLVAIDDGSLYTARGGIGYSRSYSGALLKYTRDSVGISHNPTVNVPAMRTQPLL